MRDHRSPDLTLLLRRSVEGDKQAREQLWTALHDQLRALAQARLAHEARRAFQATELVHEAFIKLEGLKITPKDRGHFLGLAARAMRQVLVDQARSRQRDKRGRGQAAVTLMTRDLAGAEPAQVDVLDLDGALRALESLDARKARAVELSYFGGMTDGEVADALALSTATVKRDLRTARAWLATALEQKKLQ